MASRIALVLRCAHCRKPFEARSPRQIYCSVPCRQLAFRGYAVGTFPTRGALRVLKCPCCGASRDRGEYVKGALGHHELAALTQKFTDRGIKWEKRRPDAEQLGTLARAVLTAGDRLREQLGGELPAPDPVGAVADVLADPTPDGDTYAAIVTAFATTSRPHVLLDRLRDISQAIETHLLGR